MSRPKFTLTADYLRMHFRYDPESGLFTRFTALARGPKVAAGTVAGAPDGIGYLRFRIGQTTFKCHRLAWLYMMGEWPDGDLDHIDGNRSNNRWLNLRLATRTLNTQNLKGATINSRSGFLGVYPKRKKFAAKIVAQGTPVYLGVFDTAEEAYAVYLEAKRRLHIGNTL